MNLVPKELIQERRIDVIDADEDITLVSVQDDVDKEMFDVDTLVGDEVFVEQEVVVKKANDEVNVVEEVVDDAQVSTAATTVTITTEEITLAQALKTLKTLKPTAKGIVFQEPYFKTKLVEEKENRVGEELIQESTKKQKVEDDKKTAKLKQLMEIIPNEEEVAIDAILLAVKSSRIVDWKIYKKGKKSYYQIVRADGKSQMYMIFS
nr:hypothetical protein [Tanacetum cinerariifolium]